ncbi:unnamed protein product [Linum tenue]|uniref:DUF569 domain-containing protein n=1 Tax=Linum tenue TaxID=586396 RepID=A0AAV0N4P5_9ROSI|nr:unnamed protein product [Linum tenue]
MELFEKARVIRLRSHHDKYLLADDDQEGVSQDRNGMSKNARWTVEIVEGYQAIRLQSCYSKYLTASSTPFLLGMTGKKVIQTTPPRLDTSVEWEPIREGVQVRLKTRHGQYLRANGGVPPWRNHVTHDIPHRTATQDWILWDVDVMELRQKCPDQRPPQGPGGRSFEASLQPPPPSFGPKPSLSRMEVCRKMLILLSEGAFSYGYFWFLFLLQSDDTFVMPAKNEGRVIKYVVANEKGQVDKDEEGSTFSFKGTEVGELKDRLEEETGMSDILVCSQNPLNGMLNPLTLQYLPPNNASMNVVVVPSAGKGWLV